MRWHRVGREGVVKNRMQCDRGLHCNSDSITFQFYFALFWLNFTFSREFAPFFVPTVPNAEKIQYYVFFNVDSLQEERHIVFDSEF